METAIAMPARKPTALTIQDLLTAKTQVHSANLKVQETNDGASIVRVDASGKSETLAYAFLVRCRDGRVKITFSRPDNPHADPVVISREFDQVRSFAAALRVVLDDHRFRSKDRTEAFVKAATVPEVAKSLPAVFSNFMFAVLHVFNRKTDKDIADQIDKLRAIIRVLGANLSEADVLRIYREEAVDDVHNL